MPRFTTKRNKGNSLEKILAIGCTVDVRGCYCSSQYILLQYIWRDDMERVLNEVFINYIWDFKLPF